MADPARAALREQVYRDIQMVLAGYPCDVALAALMDSLAAMIAVTATDRRNAGEIIGCLERDISRTVDSKWEYCRQVHAQMMAGAGAGHG